MSTQQNNSDDGRSGIVILPGATAKHYNAMLLQQLAQQTEQSAKTQSTIAAAREKMRRRDHAFWSLFSQKLVPMEETSPATAYQQHLAEIEEAPTKLLSPMPSHLQHTDAIDISLEQTRIEANWNPYDLLAGLTEIECSPVTERVPRITKQLSTHLEPLDKQSDHNYYASSACGIISLISTGVELYRRERGCDPKHIEISATAYQLLELFVSWEHGFPGQAGPIPIKGNPHLAAHAVTCWNKE